ncbi:MAG: response regulator [Pseudomonadota bacterium]
MTKQIKTAMLIDDEEFDQRQYLRVLQRSGLVETVLQYTYAEDALAHLETHPELEVDVIFLDINMPRMNGFEFLEAATEKLGADFVKTVVVMLTTSLNPDDRTRAESYDVVRDFINKPLTIEHVERVAKLV